MNSVLMCCGAKHGKDRFCATVIYIFMGIFKSGHRSLKISTTYQEPMYIPNK